MLKSINPATGEIAYEYECLDAAGVESTIAAVAQAGRAWGRTDFAQRAKVLRAVAAQLRTDQQKIGQLMTDEMGKPVREAGPEIEKAAACAEHYAEHAEAYLQDEPLASDASQSYVRYQPLGVVLSILPWNAPVWLALRTMAPALMAGNACVMKHDPHVPACAQALQQVFQDAGAPADLVRSLPVATDLVESAIRHPAVQAVSFVGSGRAGAIVAATAASEIKPSVLELGGSDPCVVLKDADLAAAADTATLSRIINAGQSCIAAKRIIVEAPVYDEFVAMLQERMEALKLGDPNLPETQVGPLARCDLRENLHRQVTESIQQGARCLLGGELPDGPGYFYPCTLLVDVTPQMTAFREETFGPLMVVSRAKDSAEALHLANDTEYGLGAAVWTQSPQQALLFANHLVAGQVAVNGIVKTDSRLPSGGVKRSGYGRELGPHGIREFTNPKQIWIK